MSSWLCTGVVIPIHLSQLRRTLPLIIEEDNPLLSSLGRQLFSSLNEELNALEERIALMEKQLERIFEQTELCRRLATIEGVGSVIATVIVAAIGDGRSF